MRTTAERTCLLAVSLTMLGVTGSARAADEPFATRATARPLPAHLQHLGSELPPPSAAGVAKTHTFYLNYDGVQLNPGGDDNAATNTTMFQEWGGNYQPYGNGAKRMASLQAALTDWAPYAVTITDQRPNGVYTMCVNTPTNIYGGGVLGVAPLDCNDSNGANIVFAFHSDNDQFTAATQATTMSQEIAHAFGLEHVNFPNDIMNPTNEGADPKFLDQCIAIVPDPNFGILCGQQHQQFCGGSQQNSHQELLWLFGAAAPDTAPPTVQITFPTDGAVIDAGTDFSITATATDDVGVSAVDLYYNGQFQESDTSEPYSWPVASIPAGNYCFKATAHDLANNATDSAEVCISVVNPADPPPSTTNDTNDTNDSSDPPDPPSTDSDGDSLSGGDDTAADSGADSDTPTSDGLGGDGGGIPGLPPDFGQDDDDSGCRVAPPLPTASLLVLALVGLGRRRRR